MSTPSLVRHVSPSEAGGRADHLIARWFGVSVNTARRFLDEGGARAAGRPLKKGDTLAAGTEVVCAGRPVSPEALAPQPEPEAPLVILYQDDALLALEKPAGTPSHPLRAGERGTLANALVARFPACAAASPDAREGGLCHRLDIETSGILLAARGRATYQALRSSFSAHQIEKTYLALVEGSLLQAQEISLPIGHDPADPGSALVARSPREIARSGAQDARTRVTPLGPRGPYTLILARTRYGRMHQVRAHLAALGHPLAGDTRYGARLPAPAGRGFWLHASELQLTHPSTGAPLVISSPPPEPLSPDSLPPRQEGDLAPK